MSREDEPRKPRFVVTSDGTFTTHLARGGTMTVGEKMVWAAVFAKYYDGKTDSHFMAAEMARYAVDSLRDEDFHQELLDGYGDEYLVLVKEMLE